jgi:hypothetical protein
MGTVTMGEVIWILFLFILQFIAPVLIVIGVIWGLRIAWKTYKTGKSIAASRGDAAAMSMERQRIKAQLITVLGVILWPVVCVAALYFGAPANVAGIAATACAGACFVWAGIFKARYNASFKENIVKTELSKVFDNLQYEPRGKFDYASVHGLDFFTHDDVIGGNDLIIAEYRGIRFAQCDLSAQEEYEVTVEDSNGDTRAETRYRDIFRGRAMRFDFAEKFRGKVQVVEKYFEGAKINSTRGEWQAVETELAEFGEHFHVFALDPLDAMAVLTPQMIEGIFYLYKTLSDPVALYFIENTMIVFMQTEREAFDVSGKHTLLEEKELLQKDIKLVTDFIETMYFKRQENQILAAGETTGSVAENISGASIAAAVGAPGGGQADAGLAAKSAVRSAKRAKNAAAYTAKKTLGFAFSFAAYALCAAYIASAVYALFKLPDGIYAGWSGDGEATGPLIPTIAWIAIAGFFVIIPLAFKTARRKPMSWVVSGVMLLIHFLFLSANM